MCRQARLTVAVKRRLIICRLVVVELRLVLRGVHLRGELRNALMRCNLLDAKDWHETTARRSLEAPYVDKEPKIPLRIDGPNLSAPDIPFFVDG